MDELLNLIALVGGFIGAFGFMEIFQNWVPPTLKCWRDPMMRFGQYWTLLSHASSSVSSCLICDFYSSGRGFASGFIQIRPPADTFAFS